MTVATTYSFGMGAGFTAHGGPLTDLDLTSLSNGGFAVAGLYYSGGTHSDVFTFDSELTPTGSSFHTNYGSAPTTIAQLSNDNIVNVIDSGTDLSFAIIDVAGTSVVSSTAMGFVPAVGSAAAQNADVAALQVGGGFVVALQEDFSMTDHDIYIMRRNANGTANGQITVENGTQLDDAPSIAGLADGGFAIAYTRTIAGVTSIRYAVYNNDGSVRLGPTLLDATGAVNRNVSVVALDDGGFAMVYEDSEAAEQYHLTYAHADSTGATITFHDLTPDIGVDAADPSTSLLSNGYVVVSFTLHAGAGDDDVYSTVVDPATGTVLAGFQSIDLDAHNAHASSLAGMGHGEFVVGWTDDTVGEQEQHVGFIRTTIGDKQANTLTGDDLRDVMDGGKRNDTLNGAGGDDTLGGGRGKDKIIGGTGADEILGSNGRDTVSYEDATSFVRANLGNQAGNFGDAAGDIYSSIENLTGSAFDDLLTGDDGVNVIEGNNGADSIDGQGGRDTLKGGGGTDDLFGGLGADKLIGGAASDTYFYSTASESTGPNYDTIDGFNGNQDKIGLGGITIDAVDPTVASGALSTASFNSDLHAAVGAGQLGGHDAVLFTPDSGTLAGHTFLVIDINNSAGYQNNVDLVIDLTNATNLSGLGTEDFLNLVGIDPGWIDPITPRVDDHFIDHVASRHLGLFDHYGAGHFLA